MTPEELQQKILELETKVKALELATSLPPDVVTSIGLELTKDYGAANTDYDIDIESTGFAAARMDGLVKIGGKMFGYYNEV